MANSKIQLGTINRLKASVVVTDFPTLNITSSYLAPEGIGLSFEGPVTTNLPAMTGVVPSQEPYQRARVSIHMLRSQFLADQWKQQVENDSFLGEVTVRPDASTLSVYYLDQVSIVQVDPMTFAGREPGYVVTLEGIYYVNADAWN